MIHCVTFLTHNNCKKKLLRVDILHTSVLCVCMRTFLTLAARCIRGDRFAPEKPGFCIPKPLASRFRGFFKLERSGDLVTDPSNVDPFDTLVTVVFIDITLPWPLLDTYGLPDESVIEIPASNNVQC